MESKRGQPDARRPPSETWLAFPFIIAFGWPSPALELAGYAFMLCAWALGAISGDALFAWLLVAIMLRMLPTVRALLLEELSFHPCTRSGQLRVLFGVTVAENLGYRQLNSWWRLIGLWRWATNARSHWGVMVRKGSLGR